MARPIDKIINRACDYPYSFPKTSFLFDSTNPIGLKEFCAADTKGRTPVLAFGSNQAPVRLAQKFGHEPHHLIPVERAQLTDFDVVYSAHITSYGAVPAMLQHCPGAIVDVAITWLDDVQLDMMHQSEITAANYHFAALDGVYLSHDDNKVSNTAFAYVGARGQLTKGEIGVALSAINCQKRAGHSMTTTEALKFIHTQMDDQVTFHDFVLSLVDDVKMRHLVTESLSASALPFNYDYRIII